MVWCLYVTATRLNQDACSLMQPRTNHRKNDLIRIFADHVVCNKIQAQYKRWSRWQPPFTNKVPVNFNQLFTSIRESSDALSPFVYTIYIHFCRRLHSLANCTPPKAYISVEKRITCKLHSKAIPRRPVLLTFLPAVTHHCRYPSPNRLLSRLLLGDERGYALLTSLSLRCATRFRW